MENKQNTDYSKRGKNGDKNIKKFMSFMLGNEDYAVELLKVQEIITYSALTPIPNTPKYLKGALNLRGKVVPVVDLREQFNMPVSDYDNRTVIIILDIQGRVIGVVVDAVKIVLNVAEDSIQAPPEFSSNIKADFIKGMCKVDERMVVIMNVDKVMTDKEIGILESIRLTHKDDSNTNPA